MNGPVLPIIREDREGIGQPREVVTQSGHHLHVLCDSYVCKIKARKLLT
jgi:hypothetical protein